MAIFTDALSVLQSLKGYCGKGLNTLFSALQSSSKKHRVVLQWIPSHCEINGNETADNLAKDGSNMEQTDLRTKYDEAKSFIKAKLNEKWTQNHPTHNKKDPYYLLTRREQVIIFRLRSTHNRLRHHMYTKFKIGETPKCSCSNEDQTTKHILQSCRMLEDLRKQFWPQPTTEAQKLYGDLTDLQCTAAFITRSGLSI